MITTAKDDEERESAALALWNLAFDSKNKEIITKTSGAVSALKKLKESKNRHVKKAASGALWEIEGKQAYEAEKKKGNVHRMHCTSRLQRFSNTKSLPVALTLSLYPFKVHFGRV